MNNVNRSLVLGWVKRNPCTMSKHDFRRGQGKYDDLWICRHCGKQIDQVAAMELSRYERYDPDLISVELKGV